MNEPKVNNQTTYNANLFVASFISISSASLHFALLVPPPPVPTKVNFTSYTGE